MNTQILNENGLWIVSLDADGEYITNGRKFVKLPRSP